MKLPRKAYLAPSGQKLGTVAELTRQGTFDDSDVPLGPDNTAYCAGVNCPPPS